MIRFEIQASGTKAANLRIRGLDDAAGDLRPAFSKVATWFYDHERKRFSSAGFGTWTPLKRRTITRKNGAMVSSAHGRIMRRTDALYNSLTRQAARGSVRRITNDRIELGTKLPYAREHQRPTGGRKLIALRDSDRRAVRTIIVDHITGAIS